MERCWGRSLVLLFFTATWYAAVPAVAQKSAADAVMDQAFAVRRFRQAAISPDGKRVAWVESLKTADGTPTADPAIYVAALSDPAARKRISAAAGAPHREHDIAWSPDGSQLAFLSDA